MIFRFCFIFLFIFNFSFASPQKITIGKIDTFYNNKITKEQLISIINEIENNFEKSLNKNIFDYSFGGKPIDLIYLPETKLELKVKEKIEKISLLELDIKNYKNILKEEKKNLDIKKEQFYNKNKILNKNITELNKYIHTINKQKNISHEQFTKIKKDINKKQIDLKKEKKELHNQYKQTNNIVNNYNKIANKYNRNIEKHNRYIRELESINRGITKVKGKTFIKRDVKTETILKDGKLEKKQNIILDMSKIEIYGFNNLNELKVILAHEIAHLVGLPHIDKKGALMNPIIQANQIKKLFLTHEDIELFKMY
jgi:hypothetical protein